MVTPKPIRVVVVDDQDMVRVGLETFFETCDDLEMVGSAATCQDAVRLCNELRPDVVLMDLMLGNASCGIVAARTILQAVPETCVIALSSFCSPELVEEVFQAGITSYLFKNVSIDELADGIRTAYDGKVVISPQVALVLNQGRQMRTGEVS